ncbi:phage tail protein [Pectobacterium parmentieri]|uniref:phage tail protein n=1 Tax=Pectobacterium parmentieri TaxID=1905730 RepID=UPI000D43393B|nr:phage tail protein [Pectobacterium parmentieri]POW30646.1 phage tail protein [Pectobacterium parmentieri]
MANLSENPQWVDGIYQIETSDPVVGGPDGVSNRQAKELASRTRYLKKEQEKTGSDLATHAVAADPHTQYAPKANPTFTGMPKAPTPATDSNSQQVATTAFVKSVVAALINDAPTALDTLQELAKSLGNDPNFSTTVLNAIADVKSEAANKLNAHTAAADPHTQYAPKASPALTGKPTAPTAVQASNDTQVATTAFVKAAVAALVNGSPAALDTLQELANALGNDPNFSTTVLNAISDVKASASSAAAIAASANTNANGRVPSGRKVNGKPLADDVTLAAGDVGAYTKAETDTKVSAAMTVANNAVIAATNANTNANGRVPSGRKVNGKALTADIALVAADIGALPVAGTATAAAKLATPRKINGVAFDGSADITLTPANLGLGEPGDFGTIAFLRVTTNANVSHVNPGDIIISTDNKPTLAFTSADGSYSLTPAVIGTWKCLGYINSSDGKAARTTLFLRIA